MADILLYLLIPIFGKSRGRRVLLSPSNFAKILLACLSKTMATSLGDVDIQANHDSEIYGVTITFMLLALIAVVLRFFTVFRLRNKKPGLDDYMVSVALVGLTWSMSPE